MSQPETTTNPSPDPVPTLCPWAGVLSYLVPGLGQIVQGRVGKGLFFMVVLLGMFHAGQAMAGWRCVYLPIPVEQSGHGELYRSYNPILSVVNYRWHYAGQFFIGASAWPAIWQFYDLPVPSEQTSPFLHDYQREPEYREKQNQLARLRGQPEFPNDVPSPEGLLNRVIVAGDKSLDIGWIYTVIAGVLNILVIYDAVAGPAFGARHVPKKPADKPQVEAAKDMNLMVYLHLPLLIVLISLVYSATRYEEWPSIFHEALRWGLRMALFLACIGGVIWIVDAIIWPRS